LGGKVRIFGPRDATLPVRTPSETREMFHSLGLRFVAGLRTSTLPRRAEEYIARMALDVAGGLLWQVLDTQSGLPLPVRLSCHEVIAATYFPAKRVVLSAGFETFAQGPRAAILDAIVCQNHGCSHVAMGQGSDVDVRDAFGAFAAGELAITPLVFGEAGFSSLTNSMVTAASLPDGSVFMTLSDAQIVDKVARDEAIAEEVVRAEAVDVVRNTSNFTLEAGFTTR
jgi:sulfate adenylyltransferase